MIFELFCNISNSLGVNCYIFYLYIICIRCKLKISIYSSSNEHWKCEPAVVLKKYCSTNYLKNCVMMSGETTGSEILEQYRNISNKLKKRFLRKPNVTEACESFTSLGQHCENTEMPSYAGLCWIAAARCEGSLGNIPGESACLIRSARQFLNAEMKNYSLGCPSPSKENLQAALSCYAHAASRYPENCPLTIGLNLEIVESLKKLDQTNLIEMYLKNALNLAENSLETKIFCLEHMASHYVKTGDYTSALEMYTEIANIIDNTPKSGARIDISLKCEINRVLLLLILRPAPQSLSPNLAQLLEKYTWGDDNNATIKSCGMSETLFILLQSLVLTCQSMDTSSLTDLEGELWFYLNKQQRNLLRYLVQSY